MRVKSKSMFVIRVLLTTLFAATSIVVAAQQPLATPPTADGTIVRPAEVPIGTEWERWSGGRYRITPGDVLEVAFTFAPEFNQTITVQPDGYVTLRDVRDLRAQGRTVAQLEEEIQAAYGEFLREPALSITLKEFEAPYFIATGEVQRPGRYELRGALTLTQAIAVAGGFTEGATRSYVVLYR
jgi:polysaccharide export outer membrane protein